MAKIDSEKQKFIESATVQIMATMVTLPVFETVSFDVIAKDARSAAESAWKATRPDNPDHK